MISSIVFKHENLLFKAVKKLFRGLLKKRIFGKLGMCTINIGFVGLFFQSDNHIYQHI